MSNPVSPVDTSDMKVYHFQDRSMRRLLQDPDYVRYLVELLMPEFVDIIKEQSPDEREVEIMAQTAAEALIEQGIAQGIEQGARQMSIESTLTILTERFPNADVTAVKPLLEAIEDLNRLKQWSRNALIAKSFRAFREQLEA